jgi:hypothetical protein
MVKAVKIPAVLKDTNLHTGAQMEKIDRPDSKAG